MKPTFLLLLFSTALFAQRPDTDTIHQWQSRKYGMFIHFGLYSELGGVWKGKQYSGNYSEQIESDAHIPQAEYRALASSFNPTQWNPDAVVQLALDAGMKFIVITSKHHDGFSMFHTRQSAYNVVDASPYKRDIVQSLAEACRRRGMPFGVYYSTIDWNFGDIPNQRNDNPISAAHEKFNVAQLKELMSGYGPITEIWFDMGHPTPLQSKDFADTVHGLQPQCMISGRVWNSEGDFSETGDDDIPDYVADEPWESPASIFAETWGYRSWQKQVPLEDKIHEHILRLVKVVSRGGNYILNIGPKGDGSVVPFEAEVLRGAGEWLRRNGTAVYGTTPQPFRHLDFGYATVKGNQLYLFVERVPKDGRLVLPGLTNKLVEARWLDSNSTGSLAASGNAVTISAVRKDTFLPVAVVKFDGTLHVVQPGIEQQADGTIELSPSAADRFYNNNGEGYWDGPTLRSEQWHVAVKRTGQYRVLVTYKPNSLARLLDLEVAGSITKVNVYGRDSSPAEVGLVPLAANDNTLISIRPAAPRDRGAKLDFDIEHITLKPM